MDVLAAFATFKAYRAAADAAADAQLLRDGRDPIVGRDLDAKFAHADN